MEKFLEKKLHSKTVYSGKIFEVTHDDVLLPNGNQATRDVVIHSGGVVIVAEKENKVLLVKQFRYPIQKALLELPAGRFDKQNEQQLETAKRELLEETGYIATDWTDLGFVYSSPGFTTEKLYFFHAKNLTFSRQQPDEDEIIDYEFFEINKIFEMIKNNKINDAKTICAMTRAYKL